MNDKLQSIIAETRRLTGAAEPALLEADAPTLVADVAADANEGSIYLIGLIGGKEVGKSSLVNVLAGRDITRPTSHGRGTETAVAYVHERSAARAKELLDRHVPGRYEMVTHDIDGLLRQVLLDLPDIDSVYAEHLQVTRSLLRHMLYPIWVQSIEKYADRRAQDLLARVAEGNDPSNFIFCLSKVDQLVAREGRQAADELRADYSRRIGKLLARDDSPDSGRSPHVMLVSAHHPEEYDLPALRKHLSIQRTSEQVRRSHTLADQQQDRSLLAWVDGQDLPGRLASCERLLNTAQELLAHRVAQPLLEMVLPAVANDPAHRSAVLEPVVERRLSRWPIVGAINGVLGPVLATMQQRLTGSGGVAGALDAQLRQTGRTLASLVQGSFAQLHQTDPLVSELYGNLRLWDDLPAERSADELRRRLLDATRRQHEVAMQLAGGHHSVAMGLLRWLLTVGAVLWFPIVQPVLEAGLQENIARTTQHVLLLAVQVMGSNHLLESLGFLSLYFLGLWILLRWGTQRRVTRLLARWTTANDRDTETNLSAQTLGWVDDLLKPLQRRRDELHALVGEVSNARSIARVAVARV